MEVLDDILKWAAGLSLWQQIAVVKVLNNDLTDDDISTLADICMREKTDPEQLIKKIGDPLTDFKKGDEDQITDGVVIKQLHSTKNINALKDDSSLTFGETGLTVVTYLLKGGFVRMPLYRELLVYFKCNSLQNACKL